MRRRALVGLLSAGLLAGGILPARAAVGSGQVPRPFDAVPAGRDTEPVVLTGASFPTWAAPADQSAKAPALGGGACQGGVDQSQCTHNRYEQPEVSTGAAAGAGVPT